MPEQSAAERTEYPTTKKLQKARTEGKVPQSQEVTSVATLVVLVATVGVLSPGLLRWLMTQTEQCLSGQAGVFAGRGAFMRFANGKILETMLVVLPILAALYAGSALACISISGLNYTPGALKLKWSAISPSSGLQGLISARSLLRLGLSVLKLLFVSLIVWMYLRSKLETLAALRWAWSIQILAVIGRIILGLMIRVCIGLIVIAIADAYYQKYKYIKDLKMTRQEVKQELRDTLGSPEVRGRIRRIQLEMAMRRIAEEVPKASVVLVNPTHVAVALRYESESMEAPALVAKGADHLAERIRQIARAYGVPVVRRPELARTIYSTVKLGSVIPANLYVAVAEVLAVIYRLRHSKT
ncbi:MAG: EscU/YscU/HrcU family type III secretion system export apparatus switch protein [Planctomycetota bacterium]|jgi:flagellar biosynthetic protein FlhB